MFPKPEIFSWDGLTCADEQKETYLQSSTGNHGGSCTELFIANFFSILHCPFEILCVVNRLEQYLVDYN